MRKVITNTTPILSLLKIDKLLLLKAKEKGLVSSVRELLTELKEKGTWINPKLFKKIILLSKEE